MAKKRANFNPLSAHALRRRCDFKSLGFSTTAEIRKRAFSVGQDRALKAIKLGLKIQSPNFNIYVMGPSGIGKRTLIKKILEKEAINNLENFDWCYVNNFADHEKPLALKLPLGVGMKLKADMKKLIPEYELSEALILLGELKKKYQKLSNVVAYLGEIEKSIIETKKIRGCEVNVLVSRAQSEGSPVVFEDNPSYANLFGWIEYTSRFGVLSTDFTLIRSGALHRANGGYLILDTLKVLSDPYAWETLKRFLFSQKIKMESPDRESEFFSTLSLEPEPIPLDIKIILLGDNETYFELIEWDTEFKKLFNVCAEFSDEITRNIKHERHFAYFIAHILEAENLRPFTHKAVALLIENSSRLASDSKKLEIHQKKLTVILQEANYLAEIKQLDVVSEVEVQNAIDSNVYRLDRIRHEIYESFSRNFILFNTKGKHVGQVNGLSVLRLDEFIFCHPMRITAATRLGRFEVFDIEREVDQGGELHTKGVLILTGFFQGFYLKEHHLSLTASLVFEQTYHEVEGDSASAAECCALLSSIADIPIKQSIAVTGSINQFGEMQTIGAVNQKIEGFFDVCKIKGLTGNQGVIIPESNISHLMLREDVIAAVKKKKFHIYPAKTINDVMSILTDLPAGSRNKKNKFPRGTINYLVERRLRRYADISSSEIKSEFLE